MSHVHVDVIEMRTDGFDYLTCHNFRKNTKEDSIKISIRKD